MGEKKKKATKTCKKNKRKKTDRLEQVKTKERNNERKKDNK